MPDDALREAARIHRQLLKLEAERTRLLAERKEKIREALRDHMATDIARELGLSTGRLSQILTGGNVADGMNDVPDERG